MDPAGLCTFHKVEAPYKVSSPSRGITREHYRNISYCSKIYSIGDTVRIDNNDGSFDVAEISDFFKDSNVRHFQFDGTFYLSEHWISTEMKHPSPWKMDKGIDPPVHPKRLMFLDRSYDFDGYSVKVIQCKVQLVDPRAKDVFYRDPRFEYDGRRKRMMSSRTPSPVTTIRNQSQVLLHRVAEREAHLSSNRKMEESLNKLQAALSRFDELRLKLDRICGRRAEEAISGNQ